MYRSFIYVLSVLFAAAVLTCSPVRQYQHAPGVTGWENDIRQLEKKDSTETDPAHGILFTGSSSIRLWSTIEEDMAPYPVIQRGYGGAKLSDFAVYCKRIVYPHKFDAMVLFVGNDITGGNDDKEPEEVLELFQYIVKQVRKKTDKPVFFIQITPTPSRWKAWSKTNRANTLIKNLCNKKEGLYFIETEREFIGADGQPKADLFRPDMLHLNEKGYDLWSTIIKENLKKIK